MLRKAETILNPKVAQAVETFKIEHRVLNCDRQYANTVDFCAHYNYPHEQCANSIILSDKYGQQFAAFLVLATTKLDVNKTARSLMGGSHVSFARMDDATRLSGMEFGGISVVGLPETVPIFIDAAVFNQPLIILGGGNRLSKLCIQPIELNFPRAYARGISCFKIT